VRTSVRCWPAAAQVHPGRDSGGVVNLHRVAPAHRDLWLRFPFQVGKLATPHARQSGVSRHPDGLKPAIPDVAGDEPPVQSLGFPGQDFDGFPKLQAKRPRPQPHFKTPTVSQVSSVPGRAAPSSLSRRQAKQCGFGRLNGHCYAVAGDHSRINPRYIQGDCRVIQKQPSLEIVGAIYNHSKSPQEFPALADVRSVNTPSTLTPD